MTNSQKQLVGVFLLLSLLVSILSVVFFLGFWAGAISIVIPVTFWGILFLVGLVFCLSPVFWRKSQNHEKGSESITKNLPHAEDK